MFTTVTQAVSCMPFLGIRSTMDTCYYWIQTLNQNDFEIKFKEVDDDELNDSF